MLKKRIRNLFYRARAVPSIVLFWVLQKYFGLAAGALIAVVYAGIYLSVAQKEGWHTRLDLAFMLLWGFILAGAAVAPAKINWLCEHYFATLLFGAFLLAALVPQAFGAEPFTTPFAKRRAAPEVWNTDAFYAINRVMSLVWIGLFLAAFLLSLASSAWLKFIVPLVMFVCIGVPLNKRFPGYYMNKYSRFNLPNKAESIPGNFNNCADSKTKKSEGSGATMDERRQACARMQGPIQKALVIFGSPRGRLGYTFQLLKTFMKGMTAGGIEVELINLADKQIKPCHGCFSCWTKTPGQCVHKDDMAELLEKMQKADLLVYAQPLYVFSVPGIVKNFLDRSLPRLEPYLIARPDGSTRHPLRWREDNPERIVIFSVCGFPEMDHFTPMLEMFRHLTKNSGGTIVGEILRTASESLLFHERYQERYTQLTDNLFLAGQQLAIQGFVEEGTEAEISRPFFSSIEHFRQVANTSWQTILEFEKRKSAGEKLPGRREYLLDHPGMLFAGMASQYDPAKAEELDAVLQFDIIDKNEGLHYFELSSEGCRLRKGQAARMDLHIRTPWQVWQQISTGKLSGQEAFQKGLFQATGDLSLLMKMTAAMH